MREYMASIMVVSTRAGFRMANLGLWGNTANLFGGFSEDPKGYMIRRWLLPAASLTEECREEKDWNEVVRSLHYQRYEHYTEEGMVPWDSNVEGVTKFSGDEKTERLHDFVLDTDVNTYREMPPTSYQSNRSLESIFIKSDGQPQTMRMTCFSGWRDLSYVSYHRGLDMCPPRGTYTIELVNNNTLEEPSDPEKVYKSNVDLYAPEDGKYWIMNQTWNFSGLGGDYSYIQIDKENYLLLELRREPSFGDIGILVTNPENPRDGRIYVFAHMYYNQCNEKYCAFTSDKKYPTFKDPSVQADTLPMNYENAVLIEKGQWLGMMGGNRGTGTTGDDFTPYPVHAHTEVYEYFPDYETDLEDDQEGNSKPITERIKSIKTIYGDDITEAQVKDNLRWQRVNPRTAFYQKYFSEDNADETQAIIDYIEEHPPVPWGEHEKDIFAKHFQEWGF